MLWFASQTFFGLLWLEAIQPSMAEVLVIVCIDKIILLFRNVKFEKSISIISLSGDSISIVKVHQISDALESGTSDQLYDVTVPGTFFSTLKMPSGSMYGRCDVMQVWTISTKRSSIQLGCDHAILQRYSTFGAKSPYRDYFHLGI